MAKKKAAKRKRRPSPRKKAAPDPAAELVEATAADQLDGLELSSLQKLFELLEKQITEQIAPPAALFTAALNILKEIKRQNGDGGDRHGDDGEAAAELALIRQHLAPLELGDESVPASELVRRIVLKLASP